MIMINKFFFIYHAAAWSAFIFYEVFVIYNMTGQLSSFLDYFLHYTLIILFFYLNARLVISSKNFATLTFFICLEIIGYVSVNYLLNFTLEHFNIVITRSTASLKLFLLTSFWRCFYFLSLSTQYGFTIKLLRSQKQVNDLMAVQMQNEKRQMMLENDLLISQNAYLRAQISPHLFFNTLNFIYNSVYKISSVTGEAVLLLSEITRYAITKSDMNGMVPLQDEVTNIDDLVRLNQLRFNSKLCIRLQLDGEYSDLRIIPLVLITLVENVFKYAELYDPQHHAIIRMEVTDDYVNFSTRNKVRVDAVKYKGTGVGIANSRTRLQQFYPEQFILNISETESFFFLSLSIKTSCLCLLAT